MATLPRILIYSPPEALGFYDHSFLDKEGYDVSTVEHIQAVDSWLNTFMENGLLLILHPDASEGMKCAAEILDVHPELPVILVAEDCDKSHLLHALRLGSMELLTPPLDPEILVQAIQRGLKRQRSLQEGNRLATIIQDLSDGFILEDLNEHVSMVNPSARQIFALGNEELQGKLTSEVFHHPDLLDILNLQGVFPKRREILVDNGRVFSAQASLVPGIGIAIVLQEITHLKELDRIKTDFVNTVSHDLRSPLTAIYGFVGLIDRVGPVNEQQVEFIRHIQASVQHITLLINDLLELGRVEADYDVQMQDVDLKKVILSSIQNLDFQLNEKMLQLTLTLPADVPTILGNPTHLERMISNLIENAIKFTPPIGKIDVRCRAEVNQLILEVADTGHGIPLDEQPLVFDKFYRASNLSTSTTGTGLGLSIVKSIVEKHHGRIWLESSRLGTTFTVILPVK